MPRTISYFQTELVIVKLFENYPSQIYQIISQQSTLPRQQVAIMTEVLTW